MKVPLAILLVIICELTVLGQRSNKKLDLVFKSSSIRQLTMEIEKLKTDKSSTIGNVWVENEFNGQLSSAVSYHQFKLDLIIPVKLGSIDYWGQESYYLEVLSQKEQLIFKRLKDKNGDLISIEYQEESLKEFLESHEQIYDTKIEARYENILLYENDDFGVACYLGRELPDKGAEMMNLVNRRNTIELMNWVKAISPLTQAYGVLGLHVLAKRGVKLNEDEIRLIMLVKNKSILIRTCKDDFSGLYEPLNILLTDKNLNEAYEYLK